MSFSKEYYIKNKERLLKRFRTNEANRRKRWLEIIGDVKCEICGYDKYFEVLEFHHNDPSKKTANLSYLMKLNPTPERLAELEDGVWLCNRCHRELHIELRSDDS